MRLTRSHLPLASRRTQTVALLAPLAALAILAACNEATSATPTSPAASANAAHAPGAGSSTRAPLAGHHVVVGPTITVPGNGTPTEATASCPTGEVAISGGHMVRLDLFATPGAFTILENRPLGGIGDPVTGWKVVFQSGGLGFHVDAYALCVPTR